MATKKLSLAEQDMLSALRTAVAAAEYLANQDKAPQSEWYYGAKKAIERLESDRSSPVSTAGCDDGVYTGDSRIAQ